MGACKFEAWDGKSLTHAASTDDELIRMKMQPGLSNDIVWVYETGSPDIFVNRCSTRHNFFAQGRNCTYICDDLTDAFKHSRVIQHRIINGDTIPTQLPRVTHQSCGMSQRSYGNWPIISGHTAKFVPCDQCSTGTQLNRPSRRHRTSWAGA